MYVWGISDILLDEWFNYNNFDVQTTQKGDSSNDEKWISKNLKGKEQID